MCVSYSAVITQLGLSVKFTEAFWEVGTTHFTESVCVLPLLASFTSDTSINKDHIKTFRYETQANQ